MPQDPHTVARQRCPRQPRPLAPPALPRRPRTQCQSCHRQRRRPSGSSPAPSHCSAE